MSDTSGSGSESTSDESCSASDGICKPKSENEPCENSCGCSNSNSGDGYSASRAPVNLANGVAQVANSYLNTEMGSFNLRFHNQYFRNNDRDNKVDVNFGVGNNWSSQQFAYMIDDVDEDEFYFNFEPETMGPIRFRRSDYTAKFGHRAKLTYDSGNGEYLVTLDSGVVYVFDEMTEMIVRKIDVNDVTTDYIGNGDRIDEIRCQYNDGSTIVTERRVLEYYDSQSGTLEGQVKRVTLQRATGLANPLPGDFADIRRIELEYYDSFISTRGNERDLKLIKQQETDNGGQTWTDDKTEYFRYYTVGEPNGLPKALKFRLSPEEYNNIQTGPNGGNPELLPDSAIAEHASVYFEYDSDRQVTKVQQQGGEVTNDMTYDVNTSQNLDLYNDWFRKATYTTADGITKTVYSNLAGADLLIDDNEDNGPGRWIHHFVYDANGRRVQARRPSAIDLSGTPYDEGDDHLDVSVKSFDGLIELTTYYSASNPFLGEIADRIEYTQVQQGTKNAPVNLTRMTYDKHTAGDGREVVTVKNRTSYRSDSGNGDPVSTSYEYQYFSGTVQLKKVTTTLPDVPSSQNGLSHPQGDTTIVEYNELGRMTSQTDAVGTKTSYQYDSETGARTKMIQDDGGLNITTDYTVDDRGRTTMVEEPLRNYLGTDRKLATWTIYQDEYETWTAQGYNDGSNGHMFNPVTINRRSEDGLTVDSITAHRGLDVETHGILSENDSFPRSSWVRWSLQRYDDDGRMTESRSYFDIPGETVGPNNNGEGFAGIHYLVTEYGYDDVGRQHWVKSPSGTITQTVFDVRGQAIETWVGTDDTGGTPDDPTGGGATGNNMTKVAYNEYDGNQAGLNGNLTKSVQVLDISGLNDRVTTFEHDWRDRQISSTSTDGTDEFIQQSTLDNLGRATVSETLRDESPTPVLIAKSETLFDDRGRTYRTLNWGVDDTGATTESLESETWYDAAGRVIKQTSPGSELFSKTKYDAIGRAVATYQSYHKGTGTAEDIASVDYDVVMSQTETEFNDASQVLLTTSRQRYHDASDQSLGRLEESGNLSLARISYVGTWYDLPGRLRYTANYGTEGSVAVTLPGAPPAATADTLVEETEYNVRGEVWKQYGPDWPNPVTTEMVYDDLGRNLRTTRNAGGTETEVTHNVYNGRGELESVKADNGIALPQTTFYTYGADAVNNDALKEVQHPDSGKVTYEYNRAGEQTKMTDQNGTEHTYSYDRAGRRRTDVVTVGSGVDDAVERIDWTFDNRGRLEKVTSFDSPFGTTAVNEVQYTYNAFGQVTKEQQQHDGAVVAGSPAVEYGYADGSDNHIRMDWVKYPGGRQVDYDYGTAGSQNDRLSRITQLDDSDGADVLYQYAGVDQPMQCNYAQPNVTWSIPGGTSGGYAGLDRFGRVIELEWNSKKYGLVAGFEYGYDRRGNRLFESNSAIAQATGTSPVAVEALLEYDNLDRVVDFQRGTLSGTNDAITGANLTQDWTLDQLGNWDAFNQGVTNALAQTRTHNSVNEITDIDETSGTSWPNPAYDSNGNMTELPQPNSLSDPSPGSYEASWDAWNRLVQLKDGSTVVVRYQYDGLNRRIVVAEEPVIEGINAGLLESDIEIIPEQFDGLPEEGEFDVTGTFFKTASGIVNIGAINGGVAVDDNATGTGWIMYSVANVDTRFTVHNNNADHLVAVRLNGTQWQYNTNLAWVNFTPVASDHLIAAVDFSANTAEVLGDRRFYYSQSAQCLEEHRAAELECQYLWGLRFVDDLVLRDRDSNRDGTLNERLYALHDLRFSVVALADPDSLIVERYTYDAYGVRSVLEPDYDSRAVSSYAFDFAYTGRRLDLDTGLYYFRARYYHAELGTFIGRDPLEFVDGMNLYRAYFVPSESDPTGMDEYSVKEYQSYLDNLAENNKGLLDVDVVMQKIATRYLAADCEDDWFWSCKDDLHNIMKAMYHNYATGKNGHKTRTSHFAGWKAVNKIDGDGSLLSHFFGGAALYPSGKLAQDLFERAFSSEGGSGPSSPSGDWHTDTAAAYMGNDFMATINLGTQSECRCLMKKLSNGTVAFSTLFEDQLYRTDWKILTKDDTTARIETFAGERLKKFFGSINCKKKSLLEIARDA